MKYFNTLRPPLSITRERPPIFSKLDDIYLKYSHKLTVKTNRAKAAVESLNGKKIIEEEGKGPDKGMQVRKVPGCDKIYNRVLRRFTRKVVVALLTTSMPSSDYDSSHESVSLPM